MMHIKLNRYDPRTYFIQLKVLEKVAINDSLPLEAADVVTFQVFYWSAYTDVVWFVYILGKTFHNSYMNIFQTPAAFSELSGP